MRVPATPFVQSASTHKIATQTASSLIQFQGRKTPEDTPVVYKAKPNKSVRMLANAVISSLQMPGARFKISVTPGLANTLKGHINAGKKLIVTPNHVSHMDFAVLIKLAQEASIKGTGMAAQEEFKRPGMGFLMPRLGMFSVDRIEGGDTSVEMAVRNLTRDGNDAFGMFGGGRLTYNGHNTHPDDQKTGPARLGFTLAEQGTHALIIPLSLYYEHDAKHTNKAVRKLLPELESEVEKQHKNNLPQITGEGSTQERVERLVDWMITERAKRFNIPLVETSNRMEQLETVRRGILEQLEQRLGKTTNDAEPASRIAKLKRALKESTLDDTLKRQARHDIKDVETLFDYGTDSMDFQNPNVLLETWIKLTKNITGNGLSKDELLAFARHCTIHVDMAEPIDMTEELSRLNRPRNHADSKRIAREIGNRLQVSLQQTGQRLAKTAQSK